MQIKLSTPLEVASPRSLNSCFLARARLLTESTHHAPRGVAVRKSCYQALATIY